MGPVDRMKKIPALPALLVALLLVCRGGALYSQNFDLAAGRLPVASLDGLWRFHTGDNPAWADPSMDDSQWPLLRSNEGWYGQGYPGYTGMAWYRFKVQAPAGLDRLTLFLPHIYTNYEVYADGQMIGSHGKMPPDPVAYGGWSNQIYPLPPGNASNRQIEIAIRVWHWQGWAKQHNGGPESYALIGDSSMIQTLFDALQGQKLSSYTNTIILSLLQTFAAIAVFILFLLRRTEREYLYFSMILAFSAVHGWVLLWFWLQPSPVTFMGTIQVVSGVLCVGLAQLAFYRQLLKARRSPFYWASFTCLVAGIAYVLLVNSSLLPAPADYYLYSLVVFLAILPNSLWILSLLLLRALQNMEDARLLLLPVLLQTTATLFQNVAIITFSAGWQHRLAYDIPLISHPFPISIEEAGNLLFLLGVFAILILRFTRTRSQEERFAAEVEAARKVQRYLIPEHLPATPGLLIESVYRPTHEVGGDFFQVLPNASDGSTLVVVGDVAGKGMEAGMLATLIVGGIRTAASFTTEPLRILSLLNERMQGRGLATCVALRIERDGSTMLANAGHLPPFLNGQEMAMEGALPLGSVPGITFPVLRFNLAEGDALMLMTDGVAEAQNSEGHLFGFEKIAEMLRNGVAAAALATAAQDFGQVDDITVLTVARSPLACSLADSLSS
jgi:hypothetical protein